MYADVTKERCSRSQLRSALEANCQPSAAAKTSHSSANSFITAPTLAAISRSSANGGASDRALHRVKPSAAGLRIHAYPRRLGRGFGPQPLTTRAAGTHTQMSTATSTATRRVTRGFVQPQLLTTRASGPRTR